MARTARIELEILGDASRLQKEFNKAARSAQIFNARVTGSFKGLSRGLGFAGATVGVAGIGLAMRGTVNAAIDFESSFAGVRKTVDATEPQLKALAADFREMSREIPVSVNELNRIGEAAGQLGVRQSAIIDFTRTVAALGVTTNLASDQAADALARIANITQLPQDQFDRLGSTVVELGNKLAATESEIVDFGLRIAAAGKIVGLTEAQTLAVAGAFTSVGVEAEAGGTAVSKVFISLANAVQSGGKQLDLFAKTAGQSTSEFARLFEQNTAGAFVAFVEGLKRVDESGGNVFQTLKNLGLTDVRLVRAFLSISQAQGLLRKSVDIGTKAWRDNNALTQEAAKRYATTASRLQVFKNRVNDLQITIGGLLVPALEDVIRPLSEWLDKTENQKRVQEGATNAIKDARAAFAAIRSVMEPLAKAAQELNKQLGGIKNTVQLLLVAFAVGKLVNFATGITGIGTAAVGATGRVNTLRTALLKLGAIAVVTVAVEVILNRKAIHEKVQDFLRRNNLGGGGIFAGLKTELAIDVSVPQLEAIREKMAALKGETDVQVIVLDRVIARLKVVDRQSLARIQGSVGKLRKNLDGIKSKKVDVLVAQRGLDRIVTQIAGLKNKSVEVKVLERGLKDLTLRLGQVQGKTVEVAFIERGLAAIQARLDNLSGRTIEIAVTTTELQRRADARGGGIGSLSEGPKKAIDDEIAEINNLARASKAKAAKAFQKLMDSLSRDLTAAGATVSEADNLRVLQQQLAAVQAQIRIQGRTKDLLDQQADISAQIVMTQRGIAESARSAAEEAKATAKAEKEAAEARTRAAREQAIANRKAEQFQALGLTREGGQRTPSASALKRRLGTLRDQIKGTALDTGKTRSQLAKIGKVLSGQFGKVGKDVRSAILQMFKDIAGALDQGTKQGPLTQTTSLNSRKILAGLGLSPEEIRALRGRLSSFNTAGTAPAGIPQFAPTGAFAGAPGPLVVESHTTINLDGDVIARAVTRRQQKNKRRNPKQKRGPNRIR